VGADVRGAHPAAGVTKRGAGGTGWEAGPERVRAPYAYAPRLPVGGPEYRPARETGREAGGTTLQG